MAAPIDPNNRFAKYTAPQAQPAPVEKEQKTPLFPNFSTGEQGVILQQGLQGTTLGRADEITDPLSVSAAALMQEPRALLTGELTDKGLIDQAVGVRDLSRAKRKKQMTERPVASILSQIGGGILGGYALGGGISQVGSGLARTGGFIGNVGKSIQSAPTAVNNFLRAGNAGTRAVKAGLAAAPIGFLYGTGDAEDGSRIQNGINSGLLSAALGPAMSLGVSGISGISGVAKSLLPKIPIPNADKVREMASAAYQTATQKGGVLSPNFSNSFLNEAKTLLNQTDIGKKFAGETPLAQTLKRFNAIKNKPITLQAAQEIDEALSNQIDNHVELGRLTKEGRQLSQLQDMWRSHVENAPENLIIGGREGFDALVEGRRLWSTSLRMGDIERIINRAMQTEVPATGIRTGFRTLLNNPSKMRGFKNSPEIVAAMKKAAEKGTVVDLMGVLGSRLLSVAGFATGNPAAAAAGYAIPAASRSAAGAIQKSKADQVLRLLAQRGGVIPQNPSLLSGVARALLGKAQKPLQYVNTPITTSNLAQALQGKSGK